VEISIPSACVNTASTHAHVRTHIVHIHTRSRTHIFTVFSFETLRNDDVNNNVFVATVY